MVLESKKYKKRIILFTIIVIICIILGIIFEKIAKKNADYIDYIYQTIQSTPEETLNEEMAKDKELSTTLKESNNKEEALKIVQSWRDPYDQLFKNSSELYAFTAIYLSLSSMIFGLIMYFDFTKWIINKIWKDIKKWLSILMRILALIILIPILIYVIIIVGIFGQIPLIVYTIYKYIKIKKTEDKDDIIEEK